MSYWNIFAGILSLALGCYLVFASYTRPNKSQLLLRLCASVIAPICLYLLFLQADKPAAASGGNKAQAVIITQGATHDSVEALLDRLPGASLYTLDAGIAADKEWKPRLIFGPAEIERPANSTEASPFIHIVGFGLEQTQLDDFRYTKRFFHPAPLADHFISVNWNRKVSVGNELMIQGAFKSSEVSNKNQTKTGSRPLKIVLSGFGITLDSITLAGADTTHFQLRTTPAQNGRAVYSLIVLKGRDTIQQQKIPFETIAAKPLSVLVLAASPDFENKFLKSWLFSNSYSLAVRTTISQNKYNREFLNITAVNSDRVNAALLNNFDLVIVDATALQKLSSAELKNIRTAVHHDGIGLIVKGDSITPRSLFFNASFNIKQSTITNKQQVHLHLSDTAQHLPSLTVERPLLLTPAPSIRPLLQDKEGHVFSATALAGNGRITYTTLANSYNWLLAGDTTQYRQWWSTLIRETAKSKMVDESFSTNPLLPVTDRPVTLTVQAADSLPFRTSVNQSLIAMQQQFLLPFQWEATVWPRKNGWQHSRSRNDELFSWYVFNSDDWHDIRAAQKIRLNSLAALQSTTPGNTSDEVTISSWEKNSKLLLIIMFIICCIYLWFEEKYLQSRQ